MSRIKFLFATQSLRAKGFFKVASNSGCKNGMEELGYALLAPLSKKYGWC
jgi:hypothetical protein